MKCLGLLGLNYVIVCLQISAYFWYAEHITPDSPAIDWWIRSLIKQSYLSTSVSGFLYTSIHHTCYIQYLYVKLVLVSKIWKFIKSHHDHREEIFVLEYGGEWGDFLNLVSIFHYSFNEYDMQFSKTWRQ